MCICDDALDKSIIGRVEWADVCRDYKIIQKPIMKIQQEKMETWFKSWDSGKIQI